MRRELRKRNWAKVVIGPIVFVIVFFTIFGWAVHQLWNVLMPEIFGLPHIGFWQALGLLTLSWLLFGGWRGMPRRRLYWSGRYRRPRRGLTPEEREQIESRLRARREASADGEKPEKEGGCEKGSRPYVDWSTRD